MNDESPVFIQQEVCATVTEFHRIRDTIFMVSASDADDAMTPNGKLQFSIVGGNDEGTYNELVCRVFGDFSYCRWQMS